MPMKVSTKFDLPMPREAIILSSALLHVWNQAAHNERRFDPAHLKMLSDADRAELARIADTSTWDDRGLFEVLLKMLPNLTLKRELAQVMANMSTNFIGQPKSNDKATFRDQATRVTTGIHAADAERNSPHHVVVGQDFTGFVKKPQALDIDFYPRRHEGKTSLFGESSRGCDIEAVVELIRTALRSYDIADVQKIRFEGGGVAFTVTVSKWFSIDDLLDEAAKGLAAIQPSPTPHPGPGI